MDLSTTEARLRPAKVEHSIKHQKGESSWTFGKR
jgi:hypothetical protein